MSFENFEFDLEHLDFDKTVEEAELKTEDLHFENSNLEQSERSENSNLENSERSENSNLEQSEHSNLGVIDKARENYKWEELYNKWKQKLGSDRFMIKNCLGDGNCQFRSIETAIGYKKSHVQLRNAIVRYINNTSNSEFVSIIEHYRIEVDNGEFVGEWDPYKIQTKRDFTKVLRREGFSFQGDNMTLSLISKSLGIDFIIFSNDYSITDLSDPSNLQSKIIILYYDKSKGHYQTIGYRIGDSKNKRVISVFNRVRLPKELNNLLDKKTFYTEHIKKICESDLQCKNVKLNDIIAMLEKKIQMKLTLEDKKMVMHLIRIWLENQRFFDRIQSKK
jgi:hypothetical protein